MSNVQQNTSLLSRLLGVITSTAFLFVVTTQSAQAYRSCADWGISFTGNAPPETIVGGDTFNFGATGMVSSKSYEFQMQAHYWTTVEYGEPIIIGTASNIRTQAFTVGPPSTNMEGDYWILVRETSGTDKCELGKIKISSSNSCTMTLDQAGFEDTYCLDEVSGEITVNVTDIYINGQLSNGHDIRIWSEIPPAICTATSCPISEEIVKSSNGSTPPVTLSENVLGLGERTVVKAMYMPPGWFQTYQTLCQSSFTMIKECDDEDRVKPPSDTVFELCQQIPKESEAFGRCARCVAGEDVSGTGIPSSPDVPAGIWTAVGCIKNDPQTIVQTAIKIGLSISGGVALLMIMAASFSLSTSQGDAKKTAEAKEMVTSAVVGIIFIIMSVTILEFIGVKIFQIPGFGK